jgi:hypothetical protein
MCSTTKERLPATSPSDARLRPPPPRRVGVQHADLLLGRVIRLAPGQRGLVSDARLPLAEDQRSRWRSRFGRPLGRGQPWSRTSRALYTRRRLQRGRPAASLCRVRKFAHPASCPTAGLVILPSHDAARCVCSAFAHHRLNIGSSSFTFRLLRTSRLPQRFSQRPGLDRVNADAISPAFERAPQRPRGVSSRAAPKAFRTPESQGAAPISEDARQCPVQTAIQPARRGGPYTTFPPSRPGEFHPEPLTDPDMRLSPHPARATQRRLAPSGEIAGFLRSPVDPTTP